MKRTLAILFAILGWFAVLTQLYLALENRASPVPEALVRFFSYFTILTNTLVAVYFSDQVLNSNKTTFFNQKARLSAITVYILIVGIVYQVALRSVWNPEGLQKLTDELLHTVIPCLTLIYWYCYENKRQLSWHLIPSWMIYPATYLIYILVRGSISGFYPYPFVNVSEIGLPQTLLNAFIVMLVFVTIASTLIWVGRKPVN